jgi:D-alanyl-D-alanine carboxypeptidase
MTYRGFDGHAHAGRLVVHRDVARSVVGAFRDLYIAGFPVRRMVPVDVYGGSDFRSIEADNTSAFNCRYVDGTTRWSEHAYGRALDINPIENPYVSGGKTSHVASRRYVDRSRHRPGMAFEGGALVRAFNRIGWGWGGRWSSPKDYQHFSASGR